MESGRFEGNAMSRQRDYKAEYQRRIASAAKRGLSKSQGRGHARAGEASARPKPVKSDDRLEAALKLLRQSGNQSRAAKEAGVSAERFRRFLKDNALAEWRGRFWQITDQRHREMLVVSRGEVQRRDLRDFDQSSLNGEHLNAVKRFLNSNDAGLLAPFEGKSVIDAKGEAHPLETDPNTLHRLANAGSEVFEQVYRLKN
ncbi:hypothetical protein [Novosphingobium sediminicola]|uniref:Uncharacterized protein n=1 Tax=Novosphingobium sediminicola TaxID=563162 RepID=A0A7W6G8R0_9SPHN|nr:hypothetical protein [Novosphingobium sediminicola]MBB3956262.1 hypothetical protein [Novosphingobium sediminicola]